MRKLKILLNNISSKGVTKYFLCLATTFAVTTTTLHAATGAAKDPSKEEVFELKGEKLLKKKWYENNFYKAYQKSPEYRPADPALHKKLFLNYKWKALRDSIALDLFADLRNIIILIVATIFVEQLREQIVDNLSMIKGVIMFFTGKEGDSFFGDLFKYFYKQWAFRGITEAKKKLEGNDIANFDFLLDYYSSNFILMGLAFSLFNVRKSIIMTFPAMLCLVSPLLGMSLYLIIRLFQRWNSHIVPMVAFLRGGETMQLLDDMQEPELIYIENQYRLSKDKQSREIQKLIEEKLLNARKYPKERDNLLQEIKDILSLLTKEEASRPNPIISEIDLSTMYAYEPHVIAYAKRICYRSVAGISGMHHPYFLGPAGVGKTYFLQLIADILGANIAAVSFAGARVKDLIGYKEANGIPGYIGRIAEAIQKASEYGTKPVILFIDEIDKALAGAYGKEISTLCLELFESNNRSFVNPYLNGVRVYLPNLIIFAGNADLTGPFKDRVDTIEFKGYNWKFKRKILFGNKRKGYKGKLAGYCRDVNIDINDLTKEDYRAIEKILKEMEEEEKNLKPEDRDPGMRQIEIRVLRYLFRKITKEEFKKLKKQARKNKAALPRVEAF